MSNSEQLINEGIIVGICEITFIFYMIYRIYRLRKDEKTR